MSEDAPRPAEVPPGYDEEDPYADADLSAYPTWWRRNIEEFRKHGLRPYRPPRFRDGTYTPPRIAELEDELGVDIQFRALNPAVGSDWQLVVDGSTVADIGRRREGEGYTLYELTAEEFDRLVRDAVD